MTFRHALARHPLLVTVAVALVATGVLAARGYSAPPPAEPVARVLPAAVVNPVLASTYERERVFTGEVRARRESVLGFERAGRVVSVAFDEGQRVGAGDLIARLDLASLAAERKRVEAQRDEASAVLEEMRAGPRKEVIAAARNRVQDLRARVDLLTRKQARRARLMADKHVSREELDETESALVSMTAQRDAAQNALDELEAGTRLEQVRAQEARLEALAAQLKRIDVDLAQGVLRAPFAGRVAARHVDEGAVLAAGLPVVTLLETGHLEARVGIAPEAVSDLRVGQAYTVGVGARSYAGIFRRALPLTDDITRTRTVVFDLPSEAEEQAVPGQLAQVSIQESIDTSGLWVPADALVRGVRGLWAAYAVAQTEAGATVVRHHVEVLHVENERALVRGTLSAKDQVLVGDTSRVVPGQLIRPVPQQPESEADKR